MKTVQLSATMNIEPIREDFDQVMAILTEYRDQIEAWKTDYSITRAIYQMARTRRMNTVSGSPEWVRYNAIETRAFDLLGAILNGRPE